MSSSENLQNEKKCIIRTFSKTVYYFPLVLPILSVSRSIFIEGDKQKPFNFGQQPEYTVVCYWSIWLQVFSGFLPLAFCFIVSTPSSIHCICPLSLPTISDYSSLSRASIPWCASLIRPPFRSSVVPLSPRQGNIFDLEANKRCLKHILIAVPSVPIIGTESMAASVPIKDPYMVIWRQIEFLM